jgi:hypothetical protein
MPLTRLLPNDRSNELPAGRPNGRTQNKLSVPWLENDWEEQEGTVSRKERAATSLYHHKSLTDPLGGSAIGGSRRIPVADSNRRPLPCQRTTHTKEKDLDRIERPLYNRLAGNAGKNHR